jgi:hypothetical protein
MTDLMLVLKISSFSAACLTLVPSKGCRVGSPEDQFREFGFVSPASGGSIFGFDYGVKPERYSTLA